MFRYAKCNLNKKVKLFSCKPIDLTNNVKYNKKYT